MSDLLGISDGTFGVIGLLFGLLDMGLNHCPNDGCLASRDVQARNTFSIGETYFQQQQYHNAIKAYYRVEGLHEYPRWQAAALLQAGKCNEMLGHWTDAVKLYARVVEEFSETKIAGKATQRLQVAQQRRTLMQRR